VCETVCDKLSNGVESNDQISLLIFYISHIRYVKRIYGYGYAHFNAFTFCQAFGLPSRPETITALYPVLFGDRGTCVLTTCPVC